jgi:hypothetical protein
MSTQVLGKCHSTGVTITRPADTTTYTAGDVVCNAATLQIPNVARSGSAVIQHATLVSSSNPTLKGDFELWLFSATVAAVADNAAFAPTDAEMLTFVGMIPFATADFKAGLSGADGPGNAMCQSSSLAIPTTAGTLYAQLVVRNAYVPISAEVLKINLNILD